MNNLMVGRQGFYLDDNSPRSGSGTAGGGVVVVSPFSHSSSSPSSCSSSPSAAVASSPLEHHQHQQSRLPLSYYSYQPRGPTPTPSSRETEIMRGYAGGRGTSSTSTTTTSHLYHDHPIMMISMDGSSSSSPTTTRNNINSSSDEADHQHHLHQEGPPGGGGGGNAMAVVSIEKEHMFDKVVTPSDVGKLNRLVIPKQHAEKYFPLDSSTNDKGLLLNFEDRNGKPWRFRYSYWNSSQSYVMTKGWSRFVKEKKLDAGDIVSFQRGLGEVGKDRLFIDWRRRPDAPSPPLIPPYPPPSHHHHHQFSNFSHSTSWNHHPYYNFQHYNPSSRDLQYSNFQPYDYESHHLNSRIGGGYGTYGYSTTRNPCSGSIIYLNRPVTSEGGGGAAAGGVGGIGIGMGMVQRVISGGPSSVQERGMIHHEDEDEDEEEDEAMVFESVPVVQGKAAAKRLRLFGVNMDCPIEEEDQEDSSDDHHHHHHHHLQCDILSSTAINPLSSSSTTTTTSAMASSISLGPYNHHQHSSILQTMRSSHDLLNKGKAASNSRSLDLDI